MSTDIHTQLQEARVSAEAFWHLRLGKNFKATRWLNGISSFARCHNLKYIYIQCLSYVTTHSIIGARCHNLKYIYIQCLSYVTTHSIIGELIFVPTNVRVWAQKFLHIKKQTQMRDNLKLTHTNKQHWQVSVANYGVLTIAQCVKKSKHFGFFFILTFCSYSFYITEKERSVSYFHTSTTYWPES